MKKTTYTLLTFGAIAFAASALLSACVKENPDSPGYEYMPDMYRSPSVETNGINTLNDSTFVNGKWVIDSVHMGNRLPADGTIPRGFIPFPYDNSAMGDSLASLFWDNPLHHNDTIEEQGKALFEKFCIYCHGAKGDGNGKLVESGKYGAQPPSYIKLYNESKLTDGHVYHVITYGKGNMGSHASQLSPEDRFKVIEYVERLGRGDVSWSDFLKRAPKPASDSMSANKPAAAAPAK